MKKKILIICSHPDDEILGCGGTIAKNVKMGNKVAVIYTHEGSSARYTNYKSLSSKKDIRTRKEMAIKASKYLKYDILKFYNNINLQNEKNFQLRLVKSLIKDINKYKPDTIFTHHSNDLNSDHGYTFEAVINACRPTANFFVKELILFEVVSSTDWAFPNQGKQFIPNLFIDIKKYFVKKIKALQFYDAEMRNFPNSRSYKGLEHLGKYRGGQVGFEVCEAFKIIRKVN